MKLTLTNIKILLLISTFVFASDIGPLHPFLPVIAVTSTLLFGIVTWLLCIKNKVMQDLTIAGFIGVIGLTCLLVGLVTIRYLAMGMTEAATGMYDSSSTLLLLGAIITNIAGVFLLKEK